MGTYTANSELATSVSTTGLAPSPSMVATTKEAITHIKDTAKMKERPRTCFEGARRACSAACMR